MATLLQPHGRGRGVLYPFEELTMDSKWLYRGILLAASLFLCACARDVASPGASNTTARPATVAAGGTYLVGFASTSVPDGFAGAVSALGGTVSSMHAAAGIAVVSGLNGSTAAQLARVSGVAEVRPDVEIALDTPVPAAESDLDAPGIESQANPATAARYVWQWNMRAIKANEGWAAGKLGSSDVTVAILDTGIDYDAPDLNGLVDLSRSASFITSDDSLTHTFFPTRNTINDYNGHGTNVATQVSSKAVALAGVTSRTQLIGVKVLAASGRGSLSSVLDGVVWAAEHGADVANMSLGGGFAKAGLGAYVGLIARTFNYAQSKGMLVVVAAGNEEEDLDHNGNELKTYCGVPNVLCVSAVGPALATGPVDAFSFYSNYGRSAIDVAGPGGNASPIDSIHYTTSAWPWGTDIASWVWSYCAKYRIASYQTNGTPVLTACLAGNRLTGYIGTSQATPHVAGLAGLLVAEVGHHRPQLLKQRIMQSADDLGQPGLDPYYGAGRINVARALGL